MIQLAFAFAFASLSLSLSLCVFKECSLNITDDKSVSRKHALFEVKSGQEVFLTDFGSKFGTWLNGQKVEVSQRLPIRDGDFIKFGGLESEFV